MIGFKQLLKTAVRSIRSARSWGTCKCKLLPWPLIEDLWIPFTLLAEIGSNSFLQRNRIVFWLPFECESHFISQSVKLLIGHQPNPFNPWSPTRNSTDQVSCRAYGAQEREKTTTWIRHIFTVFHWVVRNLLSASFWWKWQGRTIELEFQLVLR